jgi:hypothetical protein
MLGGEKAIPTAFPDLTLEEAYYEINQKLWSF